MEEKGKADIQRITFLTIILILVLRFGKVLLHGVQRYCLGRHYVGGRGFNGRISRRGVVLRGSEEILKWVDALVFVFLSLWQVLYSSPRLYVQTHSTEYLHHEYTTYKYYHNSNLNEILEVKRIKINK